MKRKSLLIMLLVALFVPLAMNAQTKSLTPKNVLQGLTLKGAQQGSTQMDAQQGLTQMNDFSSVERISLKDLYSTTHFDEYDNNRDMRATGDYELVTASQTDWSGEYVITYVSGTTAYVLTGKASGGNYGDYTTATISNNILAATDVASYKVTIEKLTYNNNTVYTLKQGSNYLGYTSTSTSGSNYLYFATTIPTQNPQRYYWTISYSGSTLTITSVYNTRRVLKWNSSSPRFACYTSGQNAISLFKKIESSCAKPEGLAVNEESVTTNAATVTWTAGDASLWNLRYKKVDASSWTTVNGLTSATYTFSSLDDGDAYEVQVQADCGTEPSEWTASVYIYTDCAVKSLPFFCGFESVSEYGCFFPYNTSDASTVSNSQYHAGAYCWRFTGNGDTQYLLSPDFDGTTAMQLSFYYRIANATYPQYFMVGYATEDDVVWGDVVTATNTAYTEYTDVFPRGTQYVVIAYQAEENSRSYLSLDDFNFTEATGCYAPNGLTASDISASSASLSWGDFADSYNLRYRTAGGAQTFFSDDFENGLDNWTIYTDADYLSQYFDAGWWIYDASQFTNLSNHGGSYSAVSCSYMSSALNADNWLITPQVQLNGTLKFWVYSNYADEYEVLLSTGSNDERDFTVTLQGMTAAAAAWTEISIDLSRYAGQTGYIAIHHEFYDGQFLIIDDFGIYGDEIPAGSWVTVPNVTIPYTLSGLSPDTEYEWQVQSICSNGTSDWSASATFHTGSLCDGPEGLNTTDITATSATLNWNAALAEYNGRYRKGFGYDFESATPYAVDSFDPCTTYDGDGSATYTIENVSFTNDGYTGSFIAFQSGVASGLSAHSGTTFGACFAATTPANNDWFILPEITIESGDVFSFWAKEYTSTYPEAFKVGVYGGNGTMSSYLAGSASASITPTTTWEEYSYDLSAYAGQTIQLAINCVSNDAFIFCIDDIFVGNPNWSEFSCTGGSYPLDGLTLNTNYVWQVQGVNCDGNGSTTEWSGMGSFTTLDAPDVPVESITAADVNVFVGETATITATVLPADASIPAVTYTSADETIATVDENGVVSGLVAGTTTITIAATDGSGVTTTINVTVSNIDVTSITVSPSDITMMSGETATISYTVAPANATVQTVTFTSANETIATVDADGVVTGVGVGETTITIASVSNPDVTATVNVTVTSDPTKVQFTVNAPEVAAPGDVITVECVLTAPTEGTWGGFTDLTMGLYYDATAFEFVAGSLTYNTYAIGQQAAQYNSIFTPNTNTPGGLVLGITCYEYGYFVTAEGVVFSAQFTVLEGADGNYTFTAQPNDPLNFDHEGVAIPYEATPSTVEVAELETYTKHIDAYSTAGYYLIASPIGTVDPEDVENMITPKVDNQNTYDLYGFDPAQTLEWRNYRKGAFDLEVGKGYLYAHSTAVDLIFTGTAYPVDENINVTLTKAEPGDGLDFPDWNLVGNPFAVNAYFADDRDYYTMKADGSEIIAVGDEGSETRHIEWMEGVFVIAETDGETVTFTTTQPTNKGKSVTLNLSNGNNIIDRAIVRFGQGRQLPKFQLNRNSTKLYIPQDGQDYAVACTEEIGEMPVSFKAEENGTYTLNFSSVNVEFGYLHLIDNMTGADIDLLQTLSYSFEARTTDYANRFKLVFATGNATDNFAYFSNGSFVINNEGAATLQVIDVTGRILSSETINGCANVNVNAAAGVYMLRLINGDNVKVQKVVVR
jgi:hypothetical protein